MGIFRSHCEIEIDGPGRLKYREGNREFVFPVFGDESSIVIGDHPTQQRVRYFFGWYSICCEFSETARRRILPRLLRHFEKLGRRVRVLERGHKDEESRAFHGELFEARGKAIELLNEAGFAWLSHFSAVDLLHAEYGLEVCGIHEKTDVEPIAKAMQAGFPQWHYTELCHKDCGRELGWRFSIHMFPRHCGGGHCVDAE